MVDEVGPVRVNELRGIVRWEESLTIGSPVTVYWGHNQGFQAEGPALIRRITPELFAAELMQETYGRSNHGFLKLAGQAGNIFNLIPRYGHDDYGEWNRVGPRAPAPEGYER